MSRLNLFSAAFLYALGTVLAKRFNSSFQTLELSLALIFAGFLFVTIHVLVQRGSNFLRTVTRNDILSFVIIGPLGTALAFFLVLDGTRSPDLSSSIAGLLLQVDILPCLILGFLLLKEEISLNQWIGLGFTVIGAIIFLIKGNTFDGFKLSIKAVEVILGGCLFGVGIVYGRILRRRLDSLTITWVRLGSAVITYLLFTPFISFRSFLDIGTNELSLIGVYSFTNFYLAFMLITHSAKHVQSWEIGSILRSMPIFTTLLAFIVFKERIDGILSLGTLFILVGIFIVERQSFKAHIIDSEN